MSEFKRTLHKPHKLFQDMLSNNTKPFLRFPTILKMELGKQSSIVHRYIDLHLFQLIPIKFFFFPELLKAIQRKVHQEPNKCLFTFKSIIVGSCVLLISITVVVCTCTLSDFCGYSWQFLCWSPHSADPLFLWIWDCGHLLLILFTVVKIKIGCLEVL